MKPRTRPKAVSLSTFRNTFRNITPFSEYCHLVYSCITLCHLQITCRQTRGLRLLASPWRLTRPLDWPLFVRSNARSNEQRSNSAEPSFQDPLRINPPQGAGATDFIPTLDEFNAFRYTIQRIQRLYKNG